MTTTTLHDHHRAMLDASAISPEIITERGYWTATTKAELGRLGFGVNQRNVPALVIPIRDVYGELRIYQARPDVPRILKGKAVKYETPSGAGLVLDVPQRVRDTLRDPAVPLWITEGSKKVDSAISHELACIGAIGVWGWRGTNDEGGKTALPDLEAIALNDRKVYLAFDSDAMEKVEVHQALDRFASLLASRGAQVRFIYIPSPDGRKVGLDDYLAAGGTVAELLATATSELHRIPTDEPDAEPDWEPSPEALAAAKELLDDADLLERAAAAIAALGVAGDLSNAQILYLAITSRLLAQPINVAVLGPSSAGKSHLVGSVAALFPERATYTLDAMSERALVYLDADLRNRHLIVSEAAGLHRDGIGATIMRAVAWGGRVRYATVEKTGAGLRSVEIDREGPTGLITTTTGRIEPELETRLLALHVPETADVTREILRSDAMRRNGHAPAPPDLEPWHAAQWWIATEGNTEVTIPYGAALAELVPVNLVRMRRDWTQIMNLISASAILHQRQRDGDERGRIVATRDDYEIVHTLTAELFGTIAAEGVTEALRRTVRTVKMFANAGTKPTITQVARELKLDRSTVNRHALRAIDGGWLVNEEERERRPAKLAIGDALPEDKPALPTPDDLFEAYAHTPPEPTACTHTHYPDFDDVDAENECETPNTHPLHTTHTPSDSVGECAYSVHTPNHTVFLDVDAENADSVYVCSEETATECVCASCGVELLPAERALGLCFPCANPNEVPFQ